jgi:hypothetical protein
MGHSRSENASKRAKKASTQTGAPILDPTCEGLGVKFPRATRRLRPRHGQFHEDCRDKC